MEFYLFWRQNHQALIQSHMIGSMFVLARRGTLIDRLELFVETLNVSWSALNTLFEYREGPEMKLSLLG